jgi:hypothetical protein
MYLAPARLVCTITVNINRMSAFRDPINIRIFAATLNPVWKVLQPTGRSSLGFRLRCQRHRLVHPPNKNGRMVRKAPMSTVSWASNGADRIGASSDIATTHPPWSPALRRLPLPWPSPWGCKYPQGWLSKPEADIARNFISTR